MEKIKQILKFILRFFFPYSPEQYIPKRLYFFTTLTSGIAYTFIVGPYKLFVHPTVFITVPILFLIGFIGLGLHVLGKMGKRYPVFFITAQLVLNAVLWILNGGMGSPIGIAILLDFCLIFAILDVEWKKVVLFFFNLGLAGLLYFLQYTFPSLIVPYNDAKTQFFDNTVVFFASFVVIGQLFYQIFQGFQIERKRATEALKKLETDGQRDPLTGAYTRKFIEKIFEDLSNYNRKTRARFCVVMCDLDHFKMVNDTYGHLAGDAVLKEFSARAMDALRKSDYFGRYGGEEFLIVLPLVDSIGGAQIAEKVRMLISQSPMTTEEIKVTASFGVAEYRPGESFESLISHADNMLYTAKNSGRNCVRY